MMLLYLEPAKEEPKPLLQGFEASSKCEFYLTIG